MSSYSIKRKKELRQGIKVESEHKRTYEKINPKISKHNFYESIAKDHLKEDPNYYKKLKKAKL